MKLQSKSVSYNEYYPIYAKIPNENKFKGLEALGLNKAMFSKRKYLTIDEFDKLKSFYESVKSPNTIGKPAELDVFEMAKYYKQLNILINTKEDFQVLTGDEKNRIIDEQISIGKLLNRYND